jgi:Delta14-sterol reductase
MTFSEQIAALDGRSIAIGMAMVFGFVAFLFVGSLVVPGRNELGAELEDKQRLGYRLNGLALFVILVAGIVAGTLSGHLSLAIVQEHFVALWIAANVFAIGHSVALYLAGRSKPDSKRHGSAIADVWYGVALNPRWLGVDLKMFAYRPSLMGLAVINASFAYVQWETYGHLSQAMILYQAFTFVYVFNYFQFEYGMLHTWDVISERFGLMLVWGDYAFVPFCYSVTGWFLVHRMEPLPAPLLVALPALFVFGLWVFRGANSQKDRFKRDPKTHIWGRPAETIGGRILVSGFWGIGRKLNYSGEICVYISWTALTGFDAIWPWLLPLWLMGLLSHRAWRDDKRCRAKYGPLWEEYCRRARFKMVPFLY